MPRYEYRCLSCGIQFDERRSVESRDVSAICPKCGQRKAKRILENVGTVLMRKTDPADAGCASSGRFR